MKSGFVSIIGRTNVGKSTVLNAILGEKLAIVADSPQTTRNRILGVYDAPDLQIAFIDTPGIHRPKNAFSEKMVRDALAAPFETDVAIMVSDGEFSREGKGGDGFLLEKIKTLSCPKILLINKIDLFNPEALRETFAAYENLGAFDSVLTSRADKALGIPELINEVAKYLGEGERYYPDGMRSDITEEFYASELIREKLIHALKDEIPHGLFVKIASMKKEKGKLRIEADILVAKKTHKKIVIGKGGARLKSVGVKARRELEAWFGKDVDLRLWVRHVSS
jgi:GTP-binding protein Era